ncbi:MAG TPA: hypothetical protein VFU46_03375 [Gemmatimonadales bacterium]|nr:hypothetical protein [Gemmatimonadales bacterium]
MGGIVRSSPRTAPLAAPALLALLAACGGQTRSSDQVAAEPPVSVDRITDHPEAYVGARVTLTSDVGKVHGPRAFTIEDSDPALPEKLLVVTRRGVRELLADGRNLMDDDVVLVTGAVRRLSVAELERELQLDLDPEVGRHFQGKPVLVASEIRRVAKEEDEPSR